MSNSQPTRNLFERRLVHLPIASVPSGADGNPEPRATESTDTQTVSASQSATPPAPRPLDSLPRLDEHAVFVPYPTETPIQQHFQLQEPSASEQKMYLMVRPTSATNQPRLLYNTPTSHPPRRWLRNLALGFILLLLLGGGSGLLYNLWENPATRGESFFAGAALPTPSPAAAVPIVINENAVIARAVVKPLRSATLEMANNGPVAQIFVEEGQLVQAGQPLLQLDNTLQTIEVAQAKAALLQSQSNLQELVAGYRPEEIAAAQAAVDAAQARLLGAGSEDVRQSDLAAAQAQLAAAQAQLQDALNGPQEATLVEARANLQNAEAALQQATSAYNQVKWRSDIGMLPEALALQKATNDYEAAKARYDLLAQPANAATISNLRSQVEAARANLIRVQTPTKQSELDAIAAEARKAEADLKLMQAGTRPEAIARAQAEVQASELALLRTQTVLSQTVLTAPFAGMVGDISVEVGEQVAPGKSLIQLGDVSGWQIETSDLTELDIPKVQEGAPVVIEIDALPGEQLTGSVAHIKRWGEDKIGDIVYSVEVVPKQIDPRLRWNMTASVTIQGRSAQAESQTTEGTEP